MECAACIVFGFQVKGTFPHRDQLRVVHLHVNIVERRAAVERFQPYCPDRGGNGDAGERDAVGKGVLALLPIRNKKQLTTPASLRRAVRLPSMLLLLKRLLLLTV